MLPYLLRQSHVEDGLQRVADQLVIIVKGLALRVTWRAARNNLWQIRHAETVAERRAMN